MCFLVQLVPGIAASLFAQEKPYFVTYDHHLEPGETWNLDFRARLACRDLNSVHIYSLLRIRSRADEMVDVRALPGRAIHFGRQLRFYGFAAGESLPAARRKTPIKSRALP